MKKHDKNFYVWTVRACIKSIYEEWGIDMTSMIHNIKRDFPNAAKAIYGMYTGIKEKGFYQAEPIIFSKVQTVYQAISNLIPSKSEEIKFDLFTTELSKEFDKLNICSWDEYVSIHRIDLIMAILLFAEDFILSPIDQENIKLSKTELTVYGEHVIFKVSKHDQKTNVNIIIKDVIILRYEILN